MSAAFTISREALLPALTLAAKAVQRANTIPILGNVLVALERDGEGHRVDLAGTDLDAEFRASAPCRAANDAEAGGRSFTVSASRLQDIVRKLPEKNEIGFRVDKDTAVITSGRAVFRLQVLPAADFPSFSTGAFGNAFEIEAKEFARMLAAVSFAISSEETRYYLNGIHWHADGDLLCAVATDGHRLARFQAKLPEGASGMPAIIIPRRTVDLVKNLIGDKGAVRVDLSETKIRFTTEAGALSSKLIDGTFPDYRRVIPTGNDKTFDIDRKALASAIDRVTTISTERGHAVRFTFGVDQARLETSNPDSGSATEEIEISGAADDGITIGFNGKYCGEMLTAAATDRILLKLGDPGSPAIVEPIGDGLMPLFVLMPMRV